MTQKLNKEESLQLQIINLDASVLHYFNEENPLFTKNSEGVSHKLNVIFNVGETWAQVQEIESRQKGGDFILQKPIITLKATGIETLKGWNRLPMHMIELEKHLYKSPETNMPDARKKYPVFEHTYVRYPSHFIRTYTLSIWTDYIEDQNSLIETIILNQISANTITINNNNYNTIGRMQSIKDDNNFGNRDESNRILKNYITFEFEGYLIDNTTIVKKRTFSAYKVTETIAKNEK